MWADFCDVYSPNVEKNNIIEEIQTNANIAYYAMEN